MLSAYEPGEAKSKGTHFIIFEDAPNKSRRVKLLCAVQRAHLQRVRNPARHLSFQPAAVGAAMEATQVSPRQADRCFRNGGTIFETAAHRVFQCSAVAIGEDAFTTITAMQGSGLLTAAAAQGPLSRTAFFFVPRRITTKRPKRAALRLRAVLRRTSDSPGRAPISWIDQAFSTSTYYATSAAKFSIQEAGV